MNILPYNPRALVFVDGQMIKYTDMLDLKVSDTLYMAADTFQVSLRNDQYLSDWLRRDQEIKIYLGYVRNPTYWYLSELEHVFTGIIDNVEPDFNDQMTCSISGRDYSKPLLDTQFNMVFANRTASQIAESLFRKHGLTAKVTATTNIVPRDMYNQKKEWEVLQALADTEGFICYVDKDKNGYFGPRDLSDEEIEDTFYYRQGTKSNSRIKFTDSTVGAYNTVTVRHYVGQQLIEATAKNQALIDAMGGEVRERIVNSSKATSNEAAQKLADSLLAQFARYVITGKATKIIGNPLIVCEKKIAVVGCGRFDSTYYVEKVDHSWSTSGYTMDVDLTSMRPDEAAQYRQDLYSANRAILGTSTSLGKADY